MINSLPNIERAKRSFRIGKIWGYAFGGAILCLVLGYTISEFELLPSVNHLMFTGALLAVFVTYVGCASSIATLAQDLGRNYSTWIVGALLIGPVGLVIAVYRVKYIALEYGIGK